MQQLGNVEQTSVIPQESVSLKNGSVIGVKIQTNPLMRSLRNKILTLIRLANGGYQPRDYSYPLGIFNPHIVVAHKLHSQAKHRQQLIPLGTSSEDNVDVILNVGAVRLVSFNRGENLWSHRRLEMAMTAGYGDHFPIVVSPPEVELRTQTPATSLIN